MTDFTDLSNHLLDAQEIAGRLGKTKLVEVLAEQLDIIGKELLEDINKAVIKVTETEITHDRLTEDSLMHTTHDLITAPKIVTNKPDPDKPGVELI